MLFPKKRLALPVVFLLSILMVTPPAGVLAADLEIQAESAILMDSLSGKILYEKNSHARLAPASITKIMTLTLVFEALENGRLTLDDQVQAGPEAVKWGGTQIWLEEGETFSVRELVLAVAVGSANDASVALAEYIAGSHGTFVKMMNNKARELGMKDTQFINAHGLPTPGHYTSAYDIAILSRHLVNNYPAVLEYTKVWIDYLREDRGEKKTQLVNTNKLLKRYEGLDGLKTGYTSEAGHCLAATAQRGDTRFISVVLKAPSSERRFYESALLLNYGFANFETVPVAAKGAVISTLTVEKGDLRQVHLVTPEPFGVTVPKGKGQDLKREIKLTSRAVAPINKGQQLGEIVLTLDGEEVGRSPLVSREEVRRSTIFELINRYFMETWPIS